MSKYVYVDNSNLWIEGMRLSAVRNGLAADISDAINNSILDRSWRCDFGKLFQFVGGSIQDIAQAKLYGSKPPSNDSLWNAAKANNFEVITYDRNFSNQEKKIDVKIATDMIDDSYRNSIEGNANKFILVSGDTDYVPVVENLMARNLLVDVACWSHCMSHELRSKCNKFMQLDDFLDHLNLKIPSSVNV